MATYDPYSAAQALLAGDIIIDTLDKAITKCDALALTDGEALALALAHDSRALALPYDEEG